MEQQDSIGNVIRVRGTVENVVYHSEETGYGVCDIEDEQGELVTAVGTMPYVSVGEQVELYGSWMHHKVYGRQFRVERFEKVLPTEKNDILRYLASGAIKGVGPKIAKKIVDRYGEEAFDVISNHPTWLADINGISMRKAMEICEDFKEKSGVRDIIMFCNEGFSPNTAMKIYRQWGKESLGVLRQNPYCLCTDIEGIGFKRADELAKSLGIAKDDENRIKSAIEYVMGVFASRDGHTYVSIEKLQEAVSKLLEIEPSLIPRQMEALISENKLKVVKFKNETHVYLTESYLNEQYIARKLIVLDKGASAIDKINISSLISRIEREDNITYAEMQRKAIKKALENGVTVLTGGPGTGKTTIIKALLHIFSSLHMKCALCAPTGRAAKRMSDATSSEAKTIHRLLELEKLSELTSKPQFARNEKNHLDEDVIIADESSMIDVPLMAALLKAIKPGARLILIGDIYQLPSVGEGNVLNDIIESEKFSVVTLNEIFRQAENSGIVVNAHKINRGELPDFKEKYEDYFFVSMLDETEIPSYISNLCKNRLPNKYGNDIVDDIQIISPTKKGECGTQNLNVILQKSLNPPSSNKKEYITRIGKIYREGDKVMQIRNNYGIEWERNGETGNGVFNGDIGTIESIDNEEKSIVINYEGRLATYDFTLFEEIEHAYCITVHKSQGSEYPIVIIPVTKCANMLLTRNLIYTAITRAEKMVLLIGDKDILEIMVSNNISINRNTGLKNFLVNSGI